MSFRDHDGPFADVGTAALTVRVERRYRFWGMRGAWYDGHCINFLEHAGRLYLYDACFGAGPFEIDGPLPPDDNSVWGGRQLASFKAQYLDAAVDYMLGSLYNGGVPLAIIPRKCLRPGEHRRDGQDGPDTRNRRRDRWTHVRLGGIAGFLYERRTQIAC